MSASITNSFVPSDLQISFLVVLPRILLQARAHFFAVRCPHRQEDAVAETVALAWRWYVSLCQRGKNPQGFIGALTTFAARRVRSGRGLCGQEKATDALSAYAQRRKSFMAVSLSNGGSLDDHLFEEALRDNTQTPPDEQAAFRLDFPVWHTRHCDRDRRVIDDLIIGERPLVVARKHGLSPARVSQLRRAFHDDWQIFWGEPTPDSTIRV